MALMVFLPEGESRSQDQYLKTVKLRQIDHVILSGEKKIISLSLLFFRLNRGMMPD